MLTMFATVVHLVIFSVALVLAVIHAGLDAIRYLGEDKTPQPLILLAHELWAKGGKALTRYTARSMGGQCWLEISERWYEMYGFRKYSIASTFGCCLPTDCPVLRCDPEQTMIRTSIRRTRSTIFMSQLRQKRLPRPCWVRSSKVNKASSVEQMPSKLP
jgi:hypothetical protein